MVSGETATDSSAAGRAPLWVTGTQVSLEGPLKVNVWSNLAHCFPSAARCPPPGSVSPTPTLKSYGAIESKGGSLGAARVTVVLFQVVKSI